MVDIVKERPYGLPPFPLCFAVQLSSILRKEVHVEFSQTCLRSLSKCEALMGRFQCNLSNDLWLSVIRVLKAIKFFVRLSHGLHIKCGNLSSCLKVLPYMSSAAASSALFPFLKRCLDQDMSSTAPHSLQELKFLGTDDWKIFFRVCWLLRDDIFSKTKGFTAS